MKILLRRFAAWLSRYLKPAGKWALIIVLAVLLLLLLTITFYDFFNTPFR